LRDVESTRNNRAVSGVWGTWLQVCPVFADHYAANLYTPPLDAAHGAI